MKSTPQTDSDKRSPLVERFLVCSIALVLLASLTACGSMSDKRQGTVVGAGLGTAAGAAVTGSGMGAVGGGIAGGIIGHEIGEK